MRRWPPGEGRVASGQAGVRQRDMNHHIAMGTSLRYNLAASTE